MPPQELVKNKPRVSQVVKVTGMSEELLHLLDTRVRQVRATGRAEYIRELIRRDALVPPQTSKRHKARRRLGTSEQSLPAEYHALADVELKTLLAAWQNITIDPSAVSLLSGDITVLVRFLEFVSRDIVQEGISVREIEVRGSTDPEDDTTQIVVRLWVRATTETEVRQYYQALGTRIDQWAKHLSEAQRLYFVSRLSLQVRRATDV